MSAGPKSAEYLRGYGAGYSAGLSRRDREVEADRDELKQLRWTLMAITLHSGITPDQIIDAVCKAARERLNLPRSRPDGGGIEVGTGREVPPHGTAARFAMDAEVD